MVYRHITTIDGNTREGGRIIDIITTIDGNMRSRPCINTVTTTTIDVAVESFRVLNVPSADAREKRASFPHQNDEPHQVAFQKCFDPDDFAGAYVQISLSAAKLERASCPIVLVPL